MPGQFAFLSPIKPVRLSVIVPFPLSVKRGFGDATPFCRAPSSLWGLFASEGAVCPVRGTGAGAEDFEFSVPLQGPENKWHFFGFAAALNVGRIEKSNHSD